MFSIFQLHVSHNFTIVFIVLLSFGSGEWWKRRTFQVVLTVLQTTMPGSLNSVLILQKEACLLFIEVFYDTGIKHHTYSYLDWLLRICSNNKCDRYHFCLFLQTYFKSCFLFIQQSDRIYTLFQDIQRLFTVLSKNLFLKSCVNKAIIRSTKLTSNHIFVQYGRLSEKFYFFILMRKSLKKAYFCAEYRHLWKLILWNIESISDKITNFFSAILTLNMFLEL